MKKTRGIKRLISALLLFTVVVTGISIGAVSADAGSQLPKVRLVQCKDMSWEKLTHRKDKYIYIEVVKGKVTNNRGDGKVINNGGKDNFYINYRGHIDCKKGDRILTLFIYNPHTNAEDDIICRLDFKMK